MENANKRIEIRDSGWKLKRRKEKKIYRKNFSLQCVPLKKKILKKKRRRDGWIFNGCSITAIRPFFSLSISLLPPRPGRRKKSSYRDAL
jgi:hypothetical protein